MNPLINISRLEEYNKWVSLQDSHRPVPTYEEWLALNKK